MSDKNIMTLKDIYKYPTKHKEGFLQEEIELIILEFPSMNMEKFYEALVGNTCMVRDGKIITYHVDIYKAVLCGLENRNLNVSEWD